MRAATPWFSSLLLHSLFLSGLLFIARTPPELPRQLTLDFQIAPLTIPEIDETASPAPGPPPVEKTPPLVEKISPPPPVEKVSEPPLPVPKIRQAEPEEIVESIAPQPVVVEDPPLPEPVVAVSQPTVEETHVMAAATVNNSIMRATAEEARQVRTVNHVRGQVMGELGYPAVARRKGWCGKLVLGFVLCADGTVEDLEVLESSGHRILDRAALQAVAASTPFSGGYPRTEVRLPINFQLN